MRTDWREAREVAERPLTPDAATRRVFPSCGGPRHSCLRTPLRGLARGWGPRETGKAAERLTLGTAPFTLEVRSIGARPGRPLGGYE